MQAAHRSEPLVPF